MAGAAWRSASRTTAIARADPGQARRGQPQDHAVRPDRDPPGGRERRRDRRGRRRRLPVGRAVRSQLLARHPGQFEHRDFTDAIATVAKACRRHDKALGRLVPTVEDAVALPAGFDFLCYSGDVWALQGAVKAGLDEIRARTARASQAKGEDQDQGQEEEEIEVAEAAMSKFRIALSGDFKKPDGSAAFPDFDLRRSSRTRRSSTPTSRPTA